MKPVVPLNRRFYFLALAFALAVIGVYANHFQNAFQFDDAHTIVDNVYIRHIRNIPAFFTNEAMMSSLPSNAAYRPLFAASLAVDYWLAGGAKPWMFHLSNFFWFLVQGILMFFMFKKILDLACRHAWNSYTSLIAAGWYLLHPVNAETVNYISARSDSYSTLCVIASLVLYQYTGRRYLIYLVPVVLGALIKPVALVFAPLLFLYGLLFETRNAREAARQSLPAWILCAVLFAWIAVMTPDSFVARGLNSAWSYLITQPFVIFRYFRAFFLPWDLSADSDWGVFESIRDDRVWMGILFVTGLIVCAVRTRQGELRPIAFGLGWFLIALVPTSSFYPLAEVTNDHRMFFPHVGLVLAVAWAIRLFLVRFQDRLFCRKQRRTGLWMAACYMLSLYGYETVQRNKVWLSGESLWHDVTVKSPRNGRGLMNYGLTQMAKGRYDTALAYFEQALVYTPRYAHLHINLGIVKDRLGRHADAEGHFQYALACAPKYHGVYFYYGRWLADHKRFDEAVRFLEKAVGFGPGLEARHLLMKLYSRRAQWSELELLCEDTLKLSPGDATALRFMKVVRKNRARPQEAM